jgi:hypothetical protein
LQRVILNIFSLLLILSGVAAAVYGGWRYNEERGFLSRSETATARVTGNHMRGSSGKLEFCPDLKFTTKDGQTINFAGSELDCAYHVKYEKGQEVEVHYDPREPAHAQIGSFAAKSGDLVTGAVLLVLLCGVGLLVRLPLKRRRAPVA